MSILYDGMTSGPLSGEIAPYIASGEDGKILEILTRKDIPVLGDVETSVIKAYLFATGMWNTIKHTNSLACEEAMDALQIFETFELANPIYLARLTQILDDLVAETLVPAFTVDHKNAILSMGNKMISWAEQAGINPSIQDIAQALRG